MVKEKKVLLSITGVDICFDMDKQNKYSLHFFALNTKKV